MLRRKTKYFFSGINLTVAVHLRIDFMYSHIQNTCHFSTRNISVYRFLTEFLSLASFSNISSKIEVNTLTSLEPLTDQRDCQLQIHKRKEGIKKSFLLLLLLPGIETTFPIDLTEFRTPQSWIHANLWKITELSSTLTTIRNSIVLDNNFWAIEKLSQIAQDKNFRWKKIALHKTRKQMFFLKIEIRSSSK